MHSEVEMSDLTSRILVNEDSCCDSDSETESRGKIDKYKIRKKQKLTKDQVVSTSAAANSQQQPHQMVNHSTDDETESQQLNYEESPIHSTSIPSPTSIYNQDKMRRRLQFFFMNPIEKWQAKRRFVTFTT